MATEKISIPVALAVGLGAIIGAGIFVLSGTAIALAGGYALLAFVLVGIVAIFCWPRDGRTLITYAQ